MPCCWGSSAAWACSYRVPSAERPGSKRGQQHWLALQLQRDAGLLIRQGALLAIDCSNQEQRRQGLAELQAIWQQAGSIKAAEAFPTERQLQIAN